MSSSNQDKAFKKLGVWLAVLALTGAIYGGLTVYALISGLEHKVAFLSLAAVGILTAILLEFRPILRGFVAGFLTAQFALLTQILFVETYFVHNPQNLDVELPLSLSPVQFMLLFAPVGGLIAGVISATAAILTATGIKLVKRKNRGE